MVALALKNAVKAALAEGLREHREDLRDLVAEVIEDVALANAIREGEKTKPVSRAAILRALKGGR